MKNVFFLIIFFLFTGLSSFATHIMGGDLRYVCTGDGTYEFTLTVYSECGSVAKLDPKYNIFFFSPSQGIKQSDGKNFQVNQVSEVEEIIFCATQLSNCNEGGTARGIKRVTYTGVVNLKDYKKANDWTFYWKKSYRSEEINTLVLAEEEDFFVKVEMDNLAVACNSSPSIQNNPIITACVGETRTFNPVATDADGDELVYSLAPPLTDLGVEVTYSDGFSYKNFVSLESPVTVNSTTGDITFKPTVKDQVGVTDILVKEYRNGKLIGSLVISMQITTLDCNNKAPALTNFASVNKDSIAVYAGDLIDVQITGTDPDGQKVTMKQLKGKAGVLTVSDNNTLTAKGRFIWQTQYFESGKYLFTIELKDDGCPRPQVTTKTYIIEILPRFIKVVFSESPRCEGETVLFADESFSYSPTLTGDLNQWNWDFGDGTTSNNQHPSHNFSQAGTYLVKLLVGSEKGYQDSVSKEVIICGKPDFDFSNTVNCSYNSTFEDFTSEFNNCEILKRGWNFGDGTSDTIYYDACEPRIAHHNYGLLPGDVAKEFDVTLTLITFSGCKFTSPPIKVTINPSPIVNIIEHEVIFDCSSPTVDLHSEMLSNGAGDLTYLWSTGATTPDITVNAQGTYTLIVTDKTGCFSKDEVKVIPPVQSLFTQTKFCAPGDAITFTDISISRIPSKPIIEWKWDFGDGNTSTEQNPVHLYNTYGDFTVTLKVTDADGCSDLMSHVVFNTYFTEKFVIPEGPICVNNVVIVQGPSFFANEHFESLQWDFGNGQISFQKDASVVYSTPGTYDITLKVYYNRQEWDANDQPCATSVNPCAAPSYCNSTVCEKIFKKTITVNSELKVEIDPFRVCLNEQVPLSFKRTTGDLTVPIVNAKWEILNTKDNSTVIVEELNPNHIFKEGTNKVTLTVEDALGCSYTTPMISRSTEVIAIPEFTSNTVCANEVTTFTADFKDVYENIQELEWDFGNNEIIRQPYKRPNTIEKTFTNGGTYPVKLTAYTFVGCSKTFIQNVEVLNIPEVDFDANTVCAEEPVVFTNKTSVVSQNINSYQWDFGDGASSSEENPSHVYQKAGTYDVRLTAVSESGCSGFIEKQVFVKEKPKADFDTEEDLPAAYVPIHFINKSEGNIRDYLWDFGDGSTSIERNPTHLYDTAKLYSVTLIVTTHEDCTDTIVKKNNLNVHAELPSAFSPNGDGNNDVLSLLNNGIKELKTFKIYNRWGELVFDAGNNLKAGWDGTFRGKPQEVGVYVVYINALGMYDTVINYKMNITLLR